MKYIRDTYARYAVRIHEIAKFGVVGGIGFFVQLGVTDAAHLGLGVGALSAVVVGYIVATVVTFLGNRHWAFKHRRGKGLGHETMLFVLLNIVGLGIQEAVVATVHYGLHMTDPLSYNVANIVGIGLGTLFRLWSYRKWVFLDVNEEPAEVAPTVLPHEMPPPAPPHPHGAQPGQAYPHGAQPPRRTRTGPRPRRTLPGRTRTAATRTRGPRTARTRAPCRRPARTGRTPPGGTGPTARRGSPSPRRSTLSRRSTDPGSFFAGHSPRRSRRNPLPGLSAPGWRLPWPRYVVV